MELGNYRADDSDLPYGYVRDLKYGNGKQDL